LPSGCGTQTISATHVTLSPVLKSVILFIV
jgi:hypothetical protein